MADIAEGVVKQIADDSLDIVNDGLNMIQNQNNDQSTDDQNMDMDEPSSSDTNLMQVASGMLSDGIDGVLQNVSGGGQSSSPVDDVVNDVEDGVNMGMSFMGGNK
ncbi:Uncharacterised protein [Legionella steigerwaltii]|uniref:Uncharacterized protein n=1 Tax=Legionella steigerwaltii TaxID=460 RepID=A0A378LFU3_9GAMM|nr:hypothetical protein [Legionella steigerwaltii]KTD79476.1 hypothetical protein Lstg_0692 [Legionella steigerwaltii]STY24639.1 Uncharacterised protein [Legionella steigerwaltii]